MKQISFPLNKDAAQQALLQLADVIKVFPKKILGEWSGKPVNSHIYTQKQLGFGSFIAIGYQKFPQSRSSFYLHCKIPKKEQDILAAQLMIETVVNLCPKIEVYYNEELSRDMNNGKEFDEFTHKIKKLFTPNFLLTINEELAMINGTADAKKYVHKNYQRSRDYDLLFSKL